MSPKAMSINLRLVLIEARPTKGKQHEVPRGN